MFSTKKNYKKMGYVTYKELSEKEIMETYDKIIACWRDFLAQNDPGLLCDKDYFVHKKNMFEVIRRADKRDLYYYIFHELEDICEYKDIALYCFWIITLKPFMVINEDANIYNCPNEMFALYIILTTIEHVHSEKVGGEFKYPSDERIRDIVYDFKYCSISRESMISFIETFADSYGVGISFILDELEDNKCCD